MGEYYQRVLIEKPPWDSYALLEASVFGR